MKTKIFNIFTALSAAYLIFLGGFNLYCTPFEQLKNIPIANFLAAISWKITLIIFGAFCLIKLFINKEISTKILALLLLASSILHLTTQGYMYSQIGWRYLILITKYDLKSWLPDAFNLIIALSFIFITINTFKQFVGKKSAFIISAVLCAVCLTANIISTALFTNASLRFMINDLLVNKLQYICFLPTVYLALKPITKESDIK